MDIGSGASGIASLIAPILKPLATGLEFFGVGVILVGVLIATVGYIRDVFSTPQREAYERYRANLGRGILLGLEILIGADIIATIIAPLTWESVGLLGLIVLIRTFLSFSLEAEIDGQWPWTKNTRRAEGTRSTSSSLPDVR
ncbi:DUF1622 domain-containing protein [Agrobacterium fabrum]|uniref:Uncharacterized membrane protein n=1 Tax=Agrobacterium fabrum TaxID=1176649 RepID=A0A7Z7BSI1_9HYPH|nr:DUF1622 domain-containing protein [Agrobacterium fabrum]MCR6727466.1 DUF1622 domain-containing protein [Agrobacterium fabrum]WLP57640.1 DUF1622 domain-containing protein [Agrobacterium fabrum]SDB70701.1 Uncharacterized membrane protein [Agrobacterium fabrum]SDK45946.1 Uncharacterized membrane protein [Agrobacterium fabrum]SES15636.1 Uncharacterized membrane protein [Agrobacterium fabrum]